MRDKLTGDEFVRAWGQMVDGLIGAADELARLDAAAGDGDLGVTVTLGGGAIRKALPELAGEDIGTVVAKSGMAFNTAAPSTFGALFAIGAMRAGKEARGAMELDAALLARMARAAEAGIQEKGKAVRGDKTLLDALGPAADALEAAVAEGRSLGESVGAAVAAARAGAVSTRGMTAKSGRSAWIAERSAAQQDPGATAVVAMWEALNGFLKGDE